MRINNYTLVVLTTDTPHHTYFIKQIIKKNPNIIIICENNNVKPKYPTQHLIEKKNLKKLLKDLRKK